MENIRKIISLNSGLHSEFKDICKSESIYMKEVIDEIVRGFVKRYNNNKRHKRR